MKQIKFNGTFIEINSENWERVQNIASSPSSQFLAELIHANMERMSDDLRASIKTGDLGKIREHDGALSYAEELFMFLTEDLATQINELSKESQSES